MKHPIDSALLLLAVGVAVAMFVLTQLGNGTTFSVGRDILPSANREASPLIFWFVIVTQSILAIVCFGMGSAVLVLMLLGRN